MTLKSVSNAGVASETGAQAFVVAGCALGIVLIIVFALLFAKNEPVRRSSPKPHGLGVLFYLD